jgi:asparagine synthase (glutamine-hydrolysing)
VIEVAEGIPFAALTQYDVPSLYALKGEIVSRGVRAITGFEMPVFPKRRFQHGALPAESMRRRLDGTEQIYRRTFHGLYA